MQCQGDLDINTTFLLNLIHIIEGKNLYNNQTYSLNMKYHSQRLYDTLKYKLLINFDGEKMAKIV